MGYYDVRNAELSVMDMLKYDAIKDKDGVIVKDMGSHVMVLVPMENKKAHDTYRVYYDEDGRIREITGDNGNSGFVGSLRKR